MIPDEAYPPPCPLVPCVAGGWEIGQKGAFCKDLADTVNTGGQGRTEGIEACRYPYPYAGIIRIRFQGSRPTASSQPMVYGSPSVFQTIAIILSLQCQKKIKNLSQKCVLRPMAAFHAKLDSASIFIFKGASDLVLKC